MGVRTTAIRILAAEVVAVLAELRVLELWCQLTGVDAAGLDEPQREAFVARPEVPELAATPYPTLLDAGVAAARRGSLPLERWLAAVRRRAAARV